MGISDVQVVPSSSEIERAQKAARALDRGSKGRSEIAETLLNDRSQAGLLQREVRFLHGSEQAFLGVQDQSEGTLAWADLLLAALSAIEAGGLLVIDEIDASLHPRLTARLIELFRSPETNANGAQLLFSTHDATLLGTNLDGEVLKRDEIWFIEKVEGASRLYPLSDFRPRKGENRERRYLAGSYGAVPTIFADSLVRSILSARKDQADAPA